MTSPLTIDALAPAFRLLTDRTRAQMSEETLIEWARYFAEQHLMAEAVNQAVRDIVMTWEGFTWPSAEYVAKRARQKQRDVMDELHGIQGRQQALDDVSELEDQRKWDNRRQVGEAWFHEHQALGKELLAEIDLDMARLMKRVPAGQFATIPAYRAAFRQGALVGACIRQMVIWHTPGAQKEQERRQRKLARAADRRDAVAP